MDVNIHIFDTMLQRLLDMGFREVGKWDLTADGVTYTLKAEENSKNVLYAFVSEGEILYIGKTTQTLKGRMYGYQKPASTQSTNEKNNTKLKEILGAGNAVSILALPDHDLLYYGGFHLNLAAGLEDDLIKEVKPKWNGNNTSQKEIKR